MEITLNIWEFANKFNENHRFMMNDGNKMDGFSELVDQFENEWDRSENFQKFVCEFVKIRKDGIDTSNEMAAFVLTMYDLMNKAKMDKYGNDGNLYMVMNLDTQEKQYFQAKTALEAMQKFKYSMGWENGKVNDLPINKTESGRCLYMEINGETWACVNRKTDGNF